ncbi:uncharacterized protein CELE_T19B4.5 [Caenorhabditis elegans]|uniref:Uncharacterized protein n=1 Tax=Caenorhabditis elegans TaxID=6239 RepID=P91453_CAEEL|nr:Uncharacterized protein CELE_T19B4.5 [Caenorhabditis elegans]CCD62977.1 Uncharacterized protein CELE_T19B4.5 [Caenorhabditis elegans]|eukprot:NP_491661.1 Uncharacterized protein CELE_T19B4.5 [Caenorhabditis elegans]
MNPSNMNVLEQAELVIDGGDPGDEQQVAHEEIVDDGSTEMVVDHHHHPQLRGNPMHHHHYDNRQSAPAYQVPQQQSQSIRRGVGRPMAPRPQSYPHNMDMVQKLQNKNVYMPAQQRPQTRISPAGARIVSFAGRKRDNSDGLPPGVKKMNMPAARPHQQQTQQQSHLQQGQQSQKNLQPVKVVRLASSVARANPTASEHALIEIENNIKQTIEDAKVDTERLRELQEADFSQDEYHQYLGMLIMDLERSNEANSTLTTYYRERQRHEKTISEARENAFSARIRQLETENRKLRDSIHVMYYGKFNEAGGHNNIYRNDHMGQMMVEEPEEHVVIEGHVGNNQEGEEVPQEWIVEETVDEHRMHLEGMEADDHMVEDQQQQDEEHEDVKDKNLLAGGSGRSG